MKRLLTLLPLVLALSLLGPGPVEGEEPGLPLGDADLAETREVTEVAPGVTMTRIVRGEGMTPEEQWQTTEQGPWRVTVVEIDPGLARGSLRASYGPDLAGTETVSEIAAHEGALVAVNASFFAFTASSSYPGDPVGLGLYGGRLLSEPTTVASEVALLVDSDAGSLTMDHLSWRGSLVHRSTGAELTLDHLNHPPVVPRACRRLTRPTQCTRPGDVVHLSPRFSTTTPTGRGVELVLNHLGCVLERNLTRGVTLKSWQSSVQATGSQSKRLWWMGKQGCMRRAVALLRGNGERLRLGPQLYGVNGRYRLTLRGEDVAPPQGADPFFARHPRTLVGRSRAGTIVLVAIDGRQETSVGATLTEAAQVALALGLPNAVNLDGGGSTTMVVGGEVVNSPSGTVERRVGDALVFVPSVR